MKTLSYGLLVFAMSLSTSVAAAPEPQAPRTPPTYQQLKAVAAQLNQMRQSNNRGGFKKVSSDPTGDYNTCMSLCAQESEESMRGCYSITYDPSGDRYRDCELAAYTAMASCQAGCG